MTTMLEPSDYGQWVLLAAFQIFCSLILLNPVDQHVFRHTHIWWDEGNLLRYLSKYNQYIWVVSILIAFIVMVWWDVTQIAENGTLILGLSAGVAVGLVVYLSAWSAALTTSLNMLGFRAQGVIWTVTSALVSLVSSALFVMQYTHAIAWMTGQALGAAVGALGAWRTLRKHSMKSYSSDKKIDFSEFLSRSTILAFCLPLAAATSFMWLQNTGFRFLVGSGWGVAELGIFAVGLGVSAQLTSIIESLAMQFFYPFFARHISDAKTDQQTGSALSDLMNVLAPIYAIWAGFNAIFAAVLLNVLTDARYHAAVPFVIFGAMIEFMRCTTNLWSNTARAKLRTKGLIIPYGIGAAVVWLGVIGLTHIGVGLTGVSTVLLIASIATCGTMIMIMQRVLHISIDMSRLVIGLSIMCTCFAMAIIKPIAIVGRYQSMAMLISGGVAVSFLMAGMLWKNPALKRLLSISLNKT